MLYTFTTQILVTSDEGETCKNPFMNYCGSSTEKIIKVVVVVVNQNRQFEGLLNCELLIQKKNGEFPIDILQISCNSCNHLNLGYE